MFRPVDSAVKFPKLEEDVLAFWREQGIYEKSLAQREGAEPFVFYEGPPTANGMPHPGHCLTRAIKDVFPRYKTMRGYRCERKAGWDTHGLPVEVEVCKELGIHSKEEIEAYGVEPFIQKCQASVWRYMQEWERLTERLGFWVNLEEAYVTYHQSYVESVWWSLKNLFDRSLLYQGHKIVWWWAQGGTALSAGEVGQGYREVADPSVYVKFPLVVCERARQLGFDDKTSLLVWTTTPWTLPANQFAAINPDLEYVLIHNSRTNEKCVVAADCADHIVQSALKAKSSTEDIGHWQAVPFTNKSDSGKSLLGLRYSPPFNTYEGLHLRKRIARTSRPGGANNQEWDDARITEYDSNGPCPWLADFKVVQADFVTTDSGTGLVHIAPAFGEADYEILAKKRNRFLTAIAGLHRVEPILLTPVGPDGKFTDEAPEFVRGRWVKDCDKEITRDLKQRGLLFHQEQYLHDYPFCWRAEEDPLIQYPRESWFIKTTEFKDSMVENNQAINWLPEHIKAGRMGKFLESNVDWALSRERFWGTPLPIWQCQKTGKQEAIGAYEELLAKPGVAGTEVWENAKAANPELPDDLRVHKPYIDEVTYDSPFAEGARMQRVTEVIDCWYDSGAMPFAQWGYQGQTKGAAKDHFESQFPADFISEAIDQTRGWFYSQLAIATMLAGNDEARSTNDEKLGSSLPQVNYPIPFKNCIVLGLMLGEDGQKMSKSKRNYREPNEIFDKYGADALRWYLFANQPPWTSIRYSEQAIKDSIPEFLLRLWNCYSFLVIYANIDGFDPSSEASNQGRRPAVERSEIDRWILSELHRTIATVTERMDQYDNYTACGAITEFVDGLSNWWVRRSRERFWASDKASPEKMDAYWTLYECLVTASKLIAPFTPFLAETFWQNLTADNEGAQESVHLCDYPEADPALVDEALSERMALVRLISSLGRRAREGASLKVRQPLAKVEVILAETTHQAWLEEHAGVIRDELNVKTVEYTDHAEEYVDYQVLPNFKLLGKKLGKLMPKVKKALGEASGEELLANFRDNGEINLNIEGQDVALSREEIEVRLTAKEGWAAANDQGVVVVLATELTPELISEGLARDLVRVIQDRRKELGCEFTDRIEVGIVSDSPELQAAVEEHAEYIAGETLASNVSLVESTTDTAIECKLGEATATILVTPVSK